MDFELEPWVAYTVKSVAAVVAVITAYSAKPDRFRAFMSRFMPKTAQHKAVERNIDGAWRVLMDDAIERKCITSVDLLNALMACRTTGQLGEKPKQTQATERVA